MDPIIEEFTISLKYQVTVNAETGEMTTKCISRKIDKSNFEVVEAKPRKTKKVESTTPKLILDSNKYTLNSAAVEFMGVEPGNRLDIKYEKINNKLMPVIGTDETFGTKGGNVLTKSLTVAHRGSKNDELAKYGTEFDIITHGTRDGLFILKGEDNIEPQGDSNISVEDVDEDLPLNITDLIEDTDANITEIDADFFKL